MPEQYYKCFHTGGEEYIIQAALGDNLVLIRALFKVNLLFVLNCGDVVDEIFSRGLLLAFPPTPTVTREHLWHKPPRLRGSKKRI